MKTIIRYAIFFLAAAVLRVDAQEKYWIYFADKGTQERAFAAKSYDGAGAERMLGITPRSLARRTKLPFAQRIDASDLPVAPEYVSLLRSQGIVPVVASRWFNAVSAVLSEAQRRSIRRLRCVNRVEPVLVFHRDSLTLGSAHPRMLKKIGSPSAASLEYGSSYDQVEQIDVPRVHDLNITGHGVIVGMLDAGFRWRTHEALRSTNVLAEYDFIQNDSVTSNQTGDSADQDEHGTMTLSVLGGYMPGQLIGPAFGASFMLGKTEYVPAELNIEEDHWVAGLEWLERSGVDIVSTSLGYSVFDAGQQSYTYQDMNGHTAITSKAASIAARKGVLVVVAMGNEGATSWHFLTSPADADSILAIGAVTLQGAVTSFSSVGPSSDGRTKPDVCACGFEDVCAAPVTKEASTYVYRNGTSLSTPLVAGAAALVLSARPELTPMQLRDALRNTASNAAAPNNSIGWGIIDTYKALLYHGLLVSASLGVTVGADSAHTIAVTVLSPSPLQTDSLVYHYSVNGASSFITGSMQLQALIDTATNGGTYSFVLPNTATHFYITARDDSGARRSLPYGAPDMLYDAHAVPVISPMALPQSFVLAQNFPNPFNGRTTIRFALTRQEHVTLTVYDILGRVAAVLVNQDESPGYYNIPWDAPAAASGVYFYTIRTPESSATKKMIIIR